MPSADSPRGWSGISATQQQLMGLCDLDSMRQKEQMHSTGHHDSQREKETVEGGENEWWAN